MARRPTKNKTTSPSGPPVWMRRAWTSFSLDDTVGLIAGGVASASREVWQAVSWKSVLQAAIILALGIWIYYPSLFGLYLWDDDFLIQNNGVVHSPDGIKYIWTDPQDALIDFFPLTVSFEWLIWQIFYTPDRTDPAFLNMTVYFHATSLILHLMNAMLVWFLFRKMGIRLAWLGALIFTVHPALVESVAWMAELKNTMAMPPFLLAVLAWIAFDRTRRWEYYIVSFILYVIALLFKTSVVAFPVVILLYDWWKHGKVGVWDNVRSVNDFIHRATGVIEEQFWNVLPTLPFFVVAVADAWFLILYLRHGVGEQFIPGLLGGPIGRTACAGLCLIFYFSKCILPMNLMPIYPQWVVNPPDLGSAWGWLLLIAVYAGLWWYRKELWARMTGYVLTFLLIVILPMPSVDWLGEFWPWPIMAIGFWWLWERRAQPWARTAFFGFAYFFIMIGAFVGWRAISFMRFQWVMDHFLYVPILGLAGLAAAGAGDAYERIKASAPAWRIPAISAVAAILIVFVLGSRDYTKVFVDRLAYWTYCSDRNYMAWPAHNNRGNQLLEDADHAQRAGYIDEAMQLYAESKKEFLIALQLNPVYTEAHNNLGYILTREGHFPEAEQEFRTALSFTPDFESAQMNLGYDLMKEGKFSEAEAVFRQLLKSEPGSQPAQQGLDQAIQLETAQAHNNRGVELSREGKLKEAEEEFRVSLQYAPDAAAARANLNRVLQLESGPAKPPAK